MRLRNLAILLIATFPATCLSQNETGSADSLHLSTIGAPAGSPAGTSATFIQPGHIAYQENYIPESSYLPLTLTHRPLFLPLPDLQFSPAQATPLHWHNGGIMFAGRTNALKGMMQIDSGEASIYQFIGNLTLQAGGIVNRYGYFHGLHTQYGLTGSITYRFTPQLSATISGEYYWGQPPRMANGMPMPPSMLGYYARSSFGVQFDYQVNEHWGVQTGVQTVQQIGSGRRETEPVLTPYYKLNKKVAIGLPVGQFLYHILKR